MKSDNELIIEALFIVLGVTVLSFTAIFTVIFYA